ncbi:hypothetical protein [Mycolicibacterium austroafricanum]|uniref:hypothetical protein n=1 Tax=Mycolicibacterium austroafricanum TaxID=39687 RepID=UPI001CA3137F|nr:hypothetical protein [Mycolicibacterium austroafricanum]QZT62125.1 hypothetical protein JN085_24990 [Mycolicibacterium austroafricanum]
MGLQDDAAQLLADALRKRHLTTRVGHGLNPSVTILDYPNAVVTFTVDGLGGLVTKFMFDGRPLQYLDFMPTAAGAHALAEFILNQIAGDGGGTSA